MNELSKKVRAFSNEYLLPGLTKAKENEEELRIVILSLLETLAFIAEKENPDRAIEEFESYITEFLESWKVVKQASKSRSS